MNHKKKQRLCKNDLQQTNKNTPLIRCVSVICLVAVCLFAFAGCGKHVQLEEFEKLEKDFLSVSDKLASAMEEIEILKGEKEAANQEIESLKGSNSAANQEIEDLQASIGAANQEIESLKASIGTANQEIEALKASGAAAEQEIETLNALIGTANQEIEALKASGAAAEQEIEDLNTLIDTANQEIEAFEASGAAAEQEIEDLKASIDTANQEIEALKASGAAAEQAIESLNALIDTATQEIEALEAIGAAVAQEIESLNALINTANQEIEALKASGAAAEQELEALNALINTATQEIEALEASGAAAEQEIEDLKEQLKKLKDMIAQTPTEPEDEKIRIYIDQGHNPTGNHNSGATGNGLHEENLTYEMGLLLAELLEADGRFEFILSRPTASTVLGTDNSSSLAARVNGAIEFEADYLISLHINAFTADSAHGIEVLVAEESGTSYDFGSALLAGMVESTGLRNRGMKYRTDLYILTNAPMPVAIMEMGFITNPTDSALLVESPELFIEGIYNGMLNYFELPPVISEE